MSEDQAPYHPHRQPEQTLQFPSEQAEELYHSVIRLLSDKEIVEKKRQPALGQLHINILPSEANPGLLDWLCMKLSHLHIAASWEKVVDMVSFGEAGIDKPLSFYQVRVASL